MGKPVHFTRVGANLLAPAKVTGTGVARVLAGAGCTRLQAGDALPYAAANLNMRVVNAMLGLGRGGLEESFVVYHEALRAAGHEVASLLDPRAAVLDDVRRLEVPLLPVRTWTRWDPLTVWRVRRILRRWNPDVILVHGNRAGRLLLRAARGRWPVIARLPNYRFQRLLRCDGFIAILPDQRTALVRAGVPEERIFTIPSMLPRLPARRVEGPLPARVGAMGRFHPVKGLDVFLRALRWLKDQGVPFQAVLAGDGELREPLQRWTREWGLETDVTFPGWVDDKAAFFHSLGVFCLTSHHEAFARVMLEAMAHEVPLVVTDSEGPRQIVEHGRTGLVVPRGDPVALGRAIMRLLQNPAEARALARQARAKVESTYTIEATAPLLQRALETVAAR